MDPLAGQIDVLVTSGTSREHAEPPAGMTDVLVKSGASRCTLIDLLARPTFSSRAAPIVLR